VSTKVCIITTVHPPFDTRIFHKQAKTLARAGYEVVLIAQHDREEVVDGVRIIPLPKPRNRLSRMFGLTWKALRIALKQKASVYHFHDPELLIVGALLKLFTKAKVVYDVHEDYKTSILQKKYIPKLFRYILAYFLRGLEISLSPLFVLILAERYYKEFFPKGILILNYPDLDLLQKIRAPSSLSKSLSKKTPRLIYAGGITMDRGALIQAQLVRSIPGLHVFLIGRCSEKLCAYLQEMVKDKLQYLHLKVDPVHVPYTRIVEYYAVGGWIAGVALFPPSQHYIRKELTKLFEYMAFGIPVVCSSFPAWREIVEGNQCGLCVNPLNPEEIASAIKWLINHPDEAKRMGENGRRAVEKKYNWNKEAKKLLGLYKRLL